MECHRVYNIGIEVRQGRGRYCETNIVTFTPRYQLDNQSSHKLAYAQRHFTMQQVCTDQLHTLCPKNTSHVFSTVNLMLTFLLPVA